MLGVHAVGAAVSERTPIVDDAPAEEVGDELPPFDPAHPAIISAWGRKRSGKSYFNRRLYRSWPYDKLAIDVNGDADAGSTSTRILEVAKRFPDPPPGLVDGKRRYQDLTYRADPGSDTYDDDLDRAVGMALYPQDKPTLVWCGEVGEFMPTAAKVRPHMRRALMQNRHYNATLLFDGPRPVNVSPLVLAQSDVVAVFDLPNPDDRDRVAKTIGYPPARFYEECERTFRRGEHWFLLWHAPSHALYRCAPLPRDDDRER